MCGRFTLTRPDLDEVACAFGVEVEAESARLYRPRWNVAPTTGHWMLRLDRGAARLVPARFGTEGHGGRLVINARAETAADLRTFRDAFRSDRCVVPADGFYEWRGSRTDRTPLWFHAPDRGLLFLAGLAFERGGDRSFVLLTTAANGTMRPVHDRMPALLSREGAAAWLRRPDATLLRPAPEAWLTARAASPLVNDVANDCPALLDAPPPRRQLDLL